MSDIVPTRGVKIAILGFFGSVVALIASWVALSLLSGALFSEGLAIAIGLVFLGAFGISAIYCSILVYDWSLQHGSKWLEGE